MQHQRSVMNVLGGSIPRCSGDAALPERIARRASAIQHGTRRMARSTSIRVVIMAVGMLVGSGYAAAQSCPASELPDQDNLTVDNLGALAVQGLQTVAQTFTVGMAGLLTRVEMTLSQNIGVPTEDLLFDLVTTDATGRPTTTQLAHVVLPPSAISPTHEIISVDLTTFDISVSVGNVLAIVLSTSAVGNAYGWLGDVNNSYGPRGTTFINGVENQVRDMAFRTFVCSEDAIPTVSAWGLVVMALLLLAGAKVYFARRRPASWAAVDHG